MQGSPPVRAIGSKDGAITAQRILVAKQSPQTLGQIAAFTPTFDEVIQNLGPLAALVFGRVWRYCQGEEAKCWASHFKIAEDLGMSPRTVARKLERLVEAGYLFKQPRPGESSIFTIKPETFASIPMTESPTGHDREAHPPMTESPTKIQKKKQQESSGEGKPSHRKHPPSVNVFRKNAHRFPAKSWWQKLEEEIGENESDLEFWGDVVFSWVGLGWNPVNVKGMLDYYRRGEIPGKEKRNEPAGFKAIRQHAREKADG